MVNDPRPQLAIDELRRSYDNHNNSSDMIDRKAGALLNSSSLIVSLFTLLKLDLILSGQDPLYIIGIGLVFITYGLLIFFIIQAIRPRKYRTPINFDEIDTIIFDQSSDNAEKSLVIGYIDSIKINQEINKKKYSNVFIASWLLFIIVIILLIVTLLPR